MHVLKFICQDYSSVDPSILKNDSSTLSELLKHDDEESNFDGNIGMRKRSIQNLGQVIELFPLLPHREYDGTTFLTFPERLISRNLYFLNTNSGNCGFLKETFEFVIRLIVGEYCKLIKTATAAGAAGAVVINNNFIS